MMDNMYSTVLYYTVTIYSKETTVSNANRNKNNLQKNYLCIKSIQAKLRFVTIEIPVPVEFSVLLKYPLIRTAIPVIENP